MAPPARKTLRWATVVAKGRKRVGKMKRTNRRILVPASMVPCVIEEKMTLENVNGELVERYETKVADKEGFTTKYPCKCPQFLEDDGVVWARPRGLYDFVDRIDEELRDREDDFARHPLPQNHGNKNGWVSEEEEVDSDLESTARTPF